MNNINDYYSALERLINNVPVIVPIGTKISYDAVSLEAGKSKGSIKKSRPIFTDLIKKIDKLKESRKDTDGIDINRLRHEILELKNQLDNSLAREICLIIELHELKKGN
ncbi:hypothetical protein LKW57_002140 [Salmonella enterica]|jgi:hypothetical protein|nr:hypothetical protein [Salmonella enterica]